MPKPPNNLEEFSSLIKVVEHLRGPKGCPWDKEQTHETLTRFAIEEAFELAEAIELGEPEEIAEELGDLLLQVVLHSEIARQMGHFDIRDVVRVLNEKMIRRHPHVFGLVEVDDLESVKKNWAEIKAEEKAAKAMRKGKSGNTKSKSALAEHSYFEIPKALPALLRSQKIGEKTRKIHFDWEEASQVLTKVEEEIAELKEALAKADVGVKKSAAKKSNSKNKSSNLFDKSAVESEIGDVLFSVAQLARHLDLDGEQALRKTNQRFEKRFSRMRALVTADKKDWNKLKPAEREKYWEKAKKSLKS